MDNQNKWANNNKNLQLNKPFQHILSRSFQKEKAKQMTINKNLSRVGVCVRVIIMLNKDF